MTTFRTTEKSRFNPHYLLFLLVPVVVAGCGPTFLTMTYSPSSMVSATGSVSISEFKYLPAERGTVGPNQIKNTAIGSIVLSQSISGYFKDATFKEFRLIGIKVNDKDRLLTGEIFSFSIDDLGMSVDWELTVRYMLKNAQTNEVLYDSIKVVKRHTEKEPLTFNNNLNEVIRENIEALLHDDAFIKKIN